MLLLANTKLFSQSYISYKQSHSQFGHGWNAANNKYCDLMEAGVVDPAKVTINAVENSASVAGLVLTTECLVTEIPVEETEEDRQRRFDAEGMGGMMGGM